MVLLSIVTVTPLEGANKIKSWAYPHINGGEKSASETKAPVTDVSHCIILRPAEKS